MANLKIEIRAVEFGEPKPDNSVGQRLRIALIAPAVANVNRDKWHCKINKYCEADRMHYEITIAEANCMTTSNVKQSSPIYV